MPHYKDGTEAQVGDIAKGKGYNIPHEIIGTVLQVFPSESCNLRIAVAKTDEYGTAPVADDAPFKMTNGAALLKGPDGKEYSVGIYIEAGAIQDFELVHRPTVQRGAFK